MNLKSSQQGPNFDVSRCMVESPSSLRSIACKESSSRGWYSRRVLDHMSRGTLVLSDLELVTLDEADRMLDIGFRPDIEKILRRCPQSRQTLLLSATVPPPVAKLATRYMRDPEVLDFQLRKFLSRQLNSFILQLIPHVSLPYLNDYSNVSSHARLLFSAVQNVEPTKFMNVYRGVRKTRRPALHVSTGISHRMYEIV